MNSFLIKNARITNENSTYYSDVLIKKGRIEKISSAIKVSYKIQEIDAEGLWLIPGVIDDQVHFREPGLSHKGTIASESQAAVAGGTTSFMEMPNTVPPTLTQELLEQKYQIASKQSFANYSFFMGASNDNLDEVLKTDGHQVCGIKVFMGSSTGNMLVDNPQTLEKLFAECRLLIATHCEHEPTIQKNLAHFKQLYGNKLTAAHHPLIRSEEACWLSSSFAVQLAKKHKTRLHILHISTEKELSLFESDLPLSQKHITCEICVHHLAFDSRDYEQKGNFIKWNPAIKSPKDREALWNAVLSGKFDVAATDHAPHTLEEKQKPYLEAPSGGPLVQHSLLFWLQQAIENRISIEQVVTLTSHHPAILFRMIDRGFIREGYWADLVLIHPNQPHTVQKDNLLYKCGWSPFEGHTFPAAVHTTFVNGFMAYHLGQFQQGLGQRLTFIPY